MTKKTITTLKNAAANIAIHLAPAIIFQKKTQTKKNQDFFTEIKQTITCKENRPFIQLDTALNIENISKTKEQIDFLTTEVITNLKSFGVKA